MSQPADSSAFGAPGMPPRWTSSAKEGVGTAYHTSSRLWFTLSHGIVNEIYFPHVDQPNTRDLQFLITDGESFCHEERRDLDHRTEYPEQNTLLYRVTNSDPAGRYRLIKEIIGEPHSSVLLMHTRLEVLDPKLAGRLQLYLLLAPHIKGTGFANNGTWSEVDGRKFLEAQREDICLVAGCDPDFTRRSVGYVGYSDGWQDLRDNFVMDWEFQRALNGNIALTAAIDLSQRQEFTVAVAFGHSRQSAAVQLLQALATPFARQRERFVRQWQRTRPEHDHQEHTTDGGSMYRLSQCILLAHEDKMFQGAFVASLSIPWGETRDDSNPGGYHLVWTRDLVHTATAMLAGGQTESALRALIWLASVQAPDGGLPQNSWINGTAYWTKTQLDEVAAPVLLAWRLRRAGALRQFDPWPLVSRAASYLILHGPVTPQERWEENSGYSPSTLAAIIAAMVAAADFARERNDEATATCLLEYGDWLNAHVEEWTVTTSGELVPDRPRHYVRITPADPDDPGAGADPDRAMITIANGGGRHPARAIVSGDFLQLVRLGLRAPDDPVVVDSLAVIDAVLRRDLPQGPCWRRYNFDGYGQKADGGAFDGTGEGRCWPILTGERGHYELAAGRDPLPFIHTLEKFANAGGMLTEQLWDAEDLPRASLQRGGPTGAAMPLCWSHAEYALLVRSRREGIPFDRVDPAHERYVAHRTPSAREWWSFRDQPGTIRGRALRVVAAHPATVVWTADAWICTHRVNTTHLPALKLWYADLLPPDSSPGARIEFTFYWPEAQRWEGRNFAVTTGAG